MGFAKEKGKLPSHIGRPVNFKWPKDVSDRHGKGKNKGEIIDEIWENPRLNNTRPHRHRKHCWGDYSFCAQLIRWPDGRHQIRLAYYRRRCGQNSWEYASQTTVCSEPRRIKILCRKTLAIAPWFQKNPKARGNQRRKLQS